MLEQPERDTKAGRNRYYCSVKNSLCIFLLYFLRYLENLEGNSFEEVIHLAISLGGDSDTIGAMAGAIAACMYPIPESIAEQCHNILTEDLREINDTFMKLICIDSD
ncbi:MAG: ADP-ribosylglycohydrolase family protein [Prevotella sp.]|nr:ADP-ribosylglycohydrolase family protein [Prevotella sp.]